MNALLYAKAYGCHGAPPYEWSIGLASSITAQYEFAFSTWIYAMFVVYGFPASSDRTK